MSARTGRSGKSRASEPRSLEWIGGSFPVPGVVTDEAEPYHVELVIWFERPTDVIVGHRLVRAGQLAGSFETSLRESMAKPMAGPPRNPDRLRVGTEAAAAEVRAVVGPETEVVVGDTPELEAVAAAMQEHALQYFGPPGRMGEHEFRDFTSGSYLQGGLVPPEAIAELFRAARILSAMAPWKSIGDQQVMRLDIPALDVRGAVISIIGREDPQAGFVIFPDKEGLEAMLQKFDDNDGDMSAPETSMLSLMFMRLGELPEPSRQEIKRFGWSDKQARYPWVELRERDGSLVPVDRRNIAIVTAVAWTLGTFCAENEAAVTGSSFEPVSMGIETADVATVRYTLPYESYDEFESEPDRERRRRPPPRGRLRQTAPFQNAMREEAATSPAAGLDGRSWRAYREGGPQRAVSLWQRAQVQALSFGSGRGVGCVARGDGAVQHDGSRGRDRRDPALVRGRNLRCTVATP